MQDKNKSFIEITFICEFPSIQEGIFALSPITKSQLKKYKLKKSFLDKKINIGDVHSFPIDIINYLKINPKYQGQEVKILDVSRNIFSFSKPAKIHSHPLSYDEQDNCLSALCEKGYISDLKVNQNSYDRGLLYRLDYETSGLMIYIRENLLYEKLRKDFSKYIIRKVYLAIVSGEMKSGHFHHEVIGSGKKNSIIRAVKDDEEGEKISIQTKVLKSNKKYSLVKIYLNEGHRHQIRVQCSLLGHPIVGDNLYGGEESHRLFLHCHEYKIIPNGVEIVYKDDDSELSEFFDKNCVL